MDVQLSAPHASPQTVSCFWHDPTLWPRPTDLGKGPDSSQSNELLSWEFLTPDQESGGPVPSHGESYCQACSQKARDEQVQ